MRVLSVGALVLALSAQASAGETARVGALRILDARAHAPDEVGNRGAVYMTLEATGAESDRLLGAATPFAEKAELHSFWLEGCFVHRRAVEAIEFAAGGRTVLDPGGPHILLSGLRRELVEGRTIPLTLTFEKAGTVDIEVPVRD